MPLLFLFVLTIMLMVVIQLGVFGLVLTKLGLSANSAVLLLASTLFGSLINLRLFDIKSSFYELPKDFPIPRFMFNHAGLIKGKTIIAINVGGALIPLSFSLYLFSLHSLNIFDVSLAILVVTTLSYKFSRPIKGFGIGMPIFIAPISAALSALIIDPAHSAPLAYICGTFGVLIGADLLHLKDIQRMDSPIASIGGAGTFDGIFFTGIFAVLLA